MIAVARLAIMVGVAGLIPFLAAIIALLVTDYGTALILPYFYLYSAGILAFMAGIYWPLAMQLDNRCYPLSPLVTILLSQLFFVSAGIGLLLPTAAQAVLYTLAYLGLYIVDAKWMRVYWPDWYLRLRLGLTSVVVICQIAAGLIFFYG
jgi:hypothetical protein